ncbi:MAG TPA: aspartyl protease family protein [Polyangiaceae bacterium]
MTRIKLQNSYDLARARAQSLAADAIRSIETDGVADTGATTLAIPEEVAAYLGLPDVGRCRIRLADGRIRTFRVAGDLVVEILGRRMSLDAVVLPVGTTILIGQIVLAALDLVVDAKSGDVSANPEHPEGPLLEALSAA